MSFDAWQTTYCISNSVNALFGYTQPAMGAPDISQLLATLIDSTLGNPDNVKLIGQWSRAWGPCVWQAPKSNAADNSMFVAVNSDKTQYIVAIAGTGLTSSYDQKVEDIEVAHVKWPDFGAPKAGHPFIAKGTSIGLQNLLAMTYKGQTLATFLKGIQNKNATLTLTGHSLGGCLVMPLSLYLFTQSGLQQSSWSKVQVLPTAAPTPGGALFNDLFSSTFKPVVGAGYQSWNRILWNYIDVVPHAWTLAEASEKDKLPNLGQINHIYKNPTIAEVDTAVAAAAAKVRTANGIGVGYVFNTNNTVFNVNASPTSVVNNWDEFKAQALYQHLSAYGVHLGTTAFTVTKPGLMEQETMDTRLAASLPVLSEVA